MLKLYKTVKGRVRYWEAWKRDTKLWVHTGLLGHWGAVKKQPIKPRESEAAAIKRYAKEPLAEGYAPIAAKDHKMLVVQFQLESWGTTDDLEARDQAILVVKNALGWSGNGDCDGGDIGSGTTNLFCDVVDPELAVREIVLALKKAKRLEGAVIAVSKSASVDVKMRVLWPKGYRKRFSVH